MKLIFSEEAENDVEAIDAWWRENRLDAPRLFAEGLASVCQAIQRRPLILKPYSERRGMVIRRWQLERTEQHVYYVADIDNDTITVLRVWGARRKRGPKL
ncbi:MAG: type II toxin-antitoxin system RelE/ParE family toxin [Polyangiaceae bacterium]